MSGVLGLATTLAAAASHAQPGAREVTAEGPASVIPTVTRRGVSWQRATEESDAELLELSQELDSIVAEAVQDLGLELSVSESPQDAVTRVSDEDLIRRARLGWVISPRLEREGRRLRLRIIAVPPGSEVLLSKSQLIAPSQLEVKAAVMLRDLAASATARGSATAAAGNKVVDGNEVVPTRSAGRAVLALNSAALGGYIGFSLQRASGDDDARLTYPLMALGTGIGLGASLIAAEEWDVTVGDAWYLAGAAWWPAGAGLLLASGYDVQPVEDRFMYGLVGAAGGLTLATVGLSFGHIDEGGAALAHSGGAAGLLLGALTQAGYEGDTEQTPTRGMGYGAGGGVLLAGLLATQVQIDASRVLLVDLAAGLGALTGAAAASPLVFDEVTEEKNRAWIAAIGAGTVVGGVVGYFWTADLESDTAAPARYQRAAPDRLRWQPYAVPASLTATGAQPSSGAKRPGSTSGLELGVTGTW